MKRLRMPKSFTLNGLIIFVALFCVSMFAFLEHMSISISAFSSMKQPLLYLTFACLVTQIKPMFRNLLKKNKFYIIAVLAVFCVLLVVSMFANWHTEYGDSPFRATFRLLLYLVEVFLLMIVIAETGRGQTALLFLFWFLLAVTVINDLFMFTGIVSFKVGRYESYLVGTKFSVSYLHTNLLAMWVLNRRLDPERKPLRWWVVALAAVFVALVAIRVNCMTGVLGSILLVVLFRMMDGSKKNKRPVIRFTSPWVLLAALVLSVAAAFAAEAILQIPVVRYIVEDVLDRSANLTGRTNIYEMYFTNLEGHWLTGYGYGNGNEVSVSLFGYENVQNGMLQWVLQVGVPAAIAMVALMMVVFRLANRCLPEKRARFMPLVALVYMYIILGTIETTYNMAFIFWFALIFMIANERLKQPPQPTMEGELTA